MHTHLVLYERELVKRWKTLYDSESWGLNKGEGFPGGSAVKNPPANAGDTGDLGLIPGPGRSPGEGNGNSHQYSCLKNPHGQRSLVDYGLWGHRESDMTE